MKHRSLSLIVIIAAGALLLATAWNFQQDKKSIAAVIIKVKNDVERKTPTSAWTKALKLDELRSGHEVRTMENSLALIRFADESKVTVRAKSLLTVQGEIEGKRILSRDVYIERGRAVFDIKKQQTEQFRFSSPISVASIRGTAGGTGFDPGEGQADLTIIVGEAIFRNTQTNCEETVASGQTALTDTSGQCSRRAASQNELNNNDPNSNVNQGNEPEGGAPRDTTGAAGRPGPSTRFSLNMSSSGTLRTGQGALLRVALVNAPVDITGVTLFYRIQGDPSFKQLAMNISGANVSGTIPGSDIRAGTSRTFEYYFSMRGADGTTYTFPETDPEAHAYALPIAPRVVRMRIPVTDPSGTPRFLEISYEE
ncbi:MAG: FecR domain-containing protein [Bacteroidota bacterium]